MANNYDSDFFRFDMSMDVINSKSVFTHPFINVDTVAINEPFFKEGFDRNPESSYYRVDDFTAMRPDLISLFTTQTERNMDIIMRYNEISNPFSIDDGDIILVPNITETKKFINSNNSNSDEEKKRKVDFVKSNYDTRFRLGKEVKNTISDFKSRYSDIEKRNKELQDFRNLANEGDNPTKELLPPTFSDDGKKELKVLPNGTIFPGESVAKPKNGCEINLSKAELISKLVASRIKRV